jgi:hypothetical protein
MYDKPMLVSIYLISVSLLTEYTCDKTFICTYDKFDTVASDIKMHCIDELEKKTNILYSVRKINKSNATYF